METYHCEVGKMWVKSFDREAPDDVGIIRGVHKVVLMDNKSKAYKFKEKSSAKFLASKTEGHIVWF